MGVSLGASRGCYVGIIPGESGEITGVGTLGVVTSVSVVADTEVFSVGVNAIVTHLSSTHRPIPNQESIQM